MSEPDYWCADCLYTPGGPCDDHAPTDDAAEIARETGRNDG